MYSLLGVCVNRKIVLKTAASDDGKLGCTDTLFLTTMKSI